MGISKGYHNHSYRNGVLITTVILLLHTDIFFLQCKVLSVCNIIYPKKLLPELRIEGVYSSLLSSVEPMKIESKPWFYL